MLPLMRTTAVLFMIRWWDGKWFQVVPFQTQGGNEESGNAMQT